MNIVLERGTAKLRQTTARLNPIPDTRSLVFTRVSHSLARMLASDYTQSDDLKLMTLGKALGQLSEFIELGYSVRQKDMLVLIAAHCAGWIHCRKMDRRDEFTLIHAERERQIHLRRAQPNKYLVDVAHPRPDPARKYRVLFEEAGEVSRAIDILEHAPKHPLNHKNFVDELVHTAAVAVAWLESFEVQS